MADPIGPAPPAERLRRRMADLAAEGRVATELPDGPALSWRQLLERAEALGARLGGFGVGRDVRVGAVFDEADWCDFVVACFGGWLAGAVVVPVSASWPKDRRAVVLDQAEVSVTVGLDARGPGELHAEELPGRRVETPAGAAAADDLATITATSGSGGSPRLVGAVYGDVLDLDDDGDDDGDDDLHDDLDDDGDDGGGPSRVTEPVLLAVPAIGTAATQHLVSGLLNGARLLAVPHFDPHRDADLLASRAVTVISLMPSLARGLVAEVEQRGLDVGSVRSVVCSSAPLAAELFDRIAAAFPTAVVMNAFAMSEGVFLVNPHGVGPADSIGRADAETEVRIVDADGVETEAGTVGEIWLRNRVAPARRQVLGGRPGGTVIHPDGWVATADLGHVDDDGWVHFAGRRDEVVVVGGSNVSPYVVEQAVAGHPAVSDVAVVGVPDPILGHRLVVHASVDAPITPYELLVHCAEVLPAAERPSTIVLTTALPRLPGGKIDRRALLRADVAATTQPTADLRGVVRGCWLRVVGGTPLEDEDDLSPIGSFSLLATEVAGRLTAELGRQVSPGLVLQHPSVARLTAELQIRTADGSLPERPIIRRAGRPG